MAGMIASALKRFPIWPGAVPDAKPMPGPETKGLADNPVAGKPWMWVANVTRPTLTVYAPEGKNTGAAVVVLPGGGFTITVLCSVEPQAARVRAANRIKIAGRMEISSVCSAGMRRRLAKETRPAAAGFRRGTRRVSGPRRDRAP